MFRSFCISQSKVAFQWRFPSPRRNGFSLQTFIASLNFSSVSPCLILFSTFSLRESVNSFIRGRIFPQFWFQTFPNSSGRIVAFVASGDKSEGEGKGKGKGEG